MSNGSCGHCGRKPSTTSSFSPSRISGGSCTPTWPTKTAPGRRRRSTRSLRRTRNSGPRHPPRARSSPCPSSAASITTTGSQRSAPTIPAKVHRHPDRCARRPLIGCRPGDLAPEKPWTQVAPQPPGPVSAPSATRISSRDEFSRTTVVRPAEELRCRTRRRGEGHTEGPRRSLSAGPGPGDGAVARNHSDDVRAEAVRGHPRGGQRRARPASREPHHPPACTSRPGCRRRAMRRRPRSARLVGAALTRRLPQQ